MKLIGMMLARNEEWCLGLSARVALKWCDGLVIYCHSCTDGTHRIVMDLQKEYGTRLMSVNVNDPVWHEMDHRQAMLEIARADHATHAAIIDADEILTGNIVDMIRPQIEGLRPGCLLRVPLYNLRGSLERYHLNGIWGNRTASLAFMVTPDLCWEGDRFHHREPWSNLGHKWPREEIVWRKGRPGGGTMHLWGASERRLIAKHALYKLTERLRWPTKTASSIDEMYSWAIKGTGPKDCPATWTYAQVPSEWWTSHMDLIDEHPVKLVGDVWQEQACQDIIAEHGREKFAGLDLFGVA